MFRVEYDDWKNQVIWTRLTLMCFGALVVIGGTILPFSQGVFTQSNTPWPGNPLFIVNDSAWVYDRIPITHDAGIVIAIFALLIVFVEVVVQRRVAEIRAGERQRTFGILNLELAAVAVMALLVLFSGPLAGQGISATHYPATSGTPAFTVQLVILRGPGGMASIAGALICLYVIILHFHELRGLKT